jgi:hypothetical protein
MSCCLRAPILDPKLEVASRRSLSLGERLRAAEGVGLVVHCPLEDVAKINTP